MLPASVKNRLMKLISKLLLGVLLIVGLTFCIIFIIHYFNSTVTTLDNPRKLTGKTETIEVSYVNWACDCADFIEIRFYANPGYETREEDCIFLEPSKLEIQIPDSFYKNHFGRTLRLKGQFYTDLGIPTNYLKKTDATKPRKSKVFRYEEIEIIPTKE